MGFSLTKNKYLLILLVLLACVLFLLFPSLRNFNYTIDPRTNVEFETSLDTVLFEGRNGVGFRVPKAYLYIPYQMKGGEMNFSMRASMEEGMPPWTLSDSYKKRDSGTAITIEISSSDRSSGLTIEDTVNYSFNANKKFHLETHEEKYGAYDLGVYRDVFYRYLKDSYTSNGKRRVSSFFLKPIKKAERPYVIRCTANGNPKYILCTAHTAFQLNESTFINYQYHVPLKDVEKYLEYDAKVVSLVKSLIVN